MTISEKRLEIILEIMKKSEYSNGIHRQALFKELREHKMYNELFDSANKNNPNQYTYSVSALLQRAAPNMKHFNGRFGKKIYYLGSGSYTYFGNENVEQRVEIDKEIRVEILSWLKQQENSRQVKEAAAKIRINQGKYRNFLIREFKKCPIRGVENKDLLIASHIVDFSDCEEEADKSNPYNGILLSPDVDKLFDKKYISFSSINGSLLFKDDEAEKLARELLISEKANVSKYLTVERSDYLKKRNQKYKFSE